MRNKNKLISLSIVCAVIVAIMAVAFCFGACKPTESQTPGGGGGGGTVAPDPGENPGPEAPTETMEIEAEYLVSQYRQLSEYSSPNGIIALDNGEILLSDQTRCAVYRFSKAGNLITYYSSDKTVNAITLGEDGSVYSLEGGLDGEVVKLSGDLSEVSRVEVGHTPEDMVISGDKAYVVNRFSASLSVIDLTDMTVVATIGIDGREPNCLTVAGNMLYVGCHLSNEDTKQAVMSADVFVVDTTTDTVVKSIALENGASGLKDICSSPDGKRVYVSHVIGRYTFPTTQLDRGWVNTNGFSIIDTTTNTLYCTPIIDQIDLGAANPWGITVSEDGKTLCIAVSGTNEVTLIDIEKMNEKLKSVENGTGAVKALKDVVNYIPFLDGAQKRITVGVGVREIAEKSGKLYCGLYFDGAVDVLTLDSGSVQRLISIEQPEADAVRTGQILWSDANNCYQKWQSCNSCHPDGVVDGFNWDNLNDGLGNAKSAKSMLYSHRTPPVMVTGIRPDAETAVAAGMKFIQFNVLTSDKLACIDEYLKTMYPVASPSLNRNGTLTESALAGKALFEANCASCHPAPLYTDMNKYDSKLKTPNDTGIYDTPSLVEVWRTAPYMHDGSMRTIEEVVRHFAPTLTEQEVTQLSDFVRSIGNEGEQYGIEQIYIEKQGNTLYNDYHVGATVTGLTFRKQHGSGDYAKLSLKVYNKEQKLVYVSQTDLNGIPLNTKVTLTFKGKIILPEGGYISAEFYDNTGEPISSPLIIR